VVLAAGERAAGPELEQQGLDLLDECVLELALMDWFGEVEEIQDVRVAGELLGELAVGWSELGGEIGGRGADPAVQLVHDLL